MMNKLGFLLGLAVLGCAPVLAGEWVQEGADSFAAGLFAGAEIDSVGQVSLASFRGVNLALDAVASSGPNTLSGRRSVTDGNADTEWRFDNEVEVLGKWIRIDLGGDRGVSQVRLLPGKTVTQRPLFFVKGYRLEVAREAMPRRLGVSGATGGKHPSDGRYVRRLNVDRDQRGWGAAAGVGSLCAPAADAGRPAQLGLHRRGGSVWRGLPR